LIYDYYKKVETRTSELGIVAEKAIEFREFDFDEGFIKGRILFIDGSVLEFLEYVKGDARSSIDFITWMIKALWFFDMIMRLTIIYPHSRIINTFKME